MKNKRGNVTIIAVVITIFAIIAGIIVWTLAKKSQAPVKQPSATQSTSSVTQTQPANWQTYKSSEYGFEFNYPKGNTIEESGNIVRIVDSRTNGVIYKWEIIVFKNTNLNNDLKGWFDSNFDKSKNKDCKVQQSNYVINDATTLLIDSESMEDACENSGYYTMNSDKSLIVNWKFGQDATNTELVTSSFKFAK